MRTNDSLFDSKRDGLKIPPRSRVNSTLKNSGWVERTSTRENIEIETSNLIRLILPVISHNFGSIENSSKENILSIFNSTNIGNQKIFEQKLEKIASNISADIQTMKTNQNRKNFEVKNITSNEELAYYKSQIKSTTLNLVSLYDKLENSEAKAKEKVRHTEKAIKTALNHETHSLMKQFLPLLQSMYNDISKVDSRQIYKDLKSIAAHSDISTDTLLHLSKVIEKRAKKLGGNFKNEVNRKSKNVSLQTQIEQQQYISKINSTLDEIAVHSDRLGKK